MQGPETGGLSEARRARRCAASGLVLFGNRVYRSRERSGQAAQISASGNLCPALLLFNWNRVKIRRDHHLCLGRYGLNLRYERFQSLDRRLL